jgi:hypothetical protein
MSRSFFIRFWEIHMQGYSIGLASTGKALLGIWTTGICRGIERKHSHHKDIRREDAAFGCICPMRYRDGKAYLLTRWVLFAGRAALIPCTKQQLEYQKNKENGMELFTSRDVPGCITLERAACTAKGCACRGVACAYQHVKLLYSAARFI